MPELVTGTRLRDAVRDETFIHGGVVDSVAGVKYDFHIGNRILKATYSQPVDIDKLSESDRGNLRVEPGEVVFVLTHETLSLPQNIMAVLSPKRTLAHSGIMLLGGLMVDPNYSGVLWVGLYNFSSNAFPLRPGKKLISAMFYELKDDEAQDFPVLNGETDFPDTLIELIKHYKPVELKGIQDELRDTKRSLESLRLDFDTDKNWKESFKKGLETHNSQIEKLLEGLREEKDARKTDDQNIRDKLDKMGNLFTIGNVVMVIVLLLLGAILPIIFEKIAAHF